MSAHHADEGYRRVMGEAIARARVQNNRKQLLEAADVEVAGGIAETIINATNEAINAMDVPIATSLLARALIAHGLIEVAAKWWSMGSISEADALATLRSFVDKLPDCLTSENTFDPELMRQGAPIN